MCRRSSMQQESSEEDDEKSRQVRALLEHRRVEYARAGTAALGVYCACRFPVYILEHFIKGPLIHPLGFAAFGMLVIGSVTGCGSCWAPEGGSGRR